MVNRIDATLYLPEFAVWWERQILNHTMEYLKKCWVIIKGVEQRTGHKSQRQMGARNVLEIEVWTSWRKPQGRGETGN